MLVSISSAARTKASLQTHWSFVFSASAFETNLFHRLTGHSIEWLRTMRQRHSPGCEFHVAFLPELWAWLQMSKTCLRHANNADHVNDHFKHTKSGCQDTELLWLPADRQVEKTKLPSGSPSTFRYFEWSSNARKSQGPSFIPSPHTASRICMSIARYSRIFCAN